MARRAVTAVTGVPSEPFTFYMGTVGGGVWKTTDAGHSWINIYRRQFPSAPWARSMSRTPIRAIVYAGTDRRRSAAMSRSAAASTSPPTRGKTWTFIGLRDVGQIAAIRIHPHNPDDRSSPPLGNPFAHNPDRGVYRTQRRRQDVAAGALRLATNSARPTSSSSPAIRRSLYATMWHGQRKPWTIISGAARRRHLQSTDGGDHWTKLGGGLPTGLFGRANVGVSRGGAEPRLRVDRSEAGSGTVSLGRCRRDMDARQRRRRGSSRGPSITTRSASIPTMRTWSTSATKAGSRSTDGGKTFAVARDAARRQPRPLDQPAKLATIMIQSNDGGANISLDGGRRGARKRTSRRPRSTRSRSTTSSLTGCTARSRTTRR